MLKYRQLLDYFLGLLYQLKQEGKSGFFETNKIIKLFGYPASPGDIFEMVKYLEAQGFIKALYYLGGTSIQITAREILYIEEQKPEIIDDINIYLEQVKDKSKTQEEIINKSPEQMAEERKIIFEKLDQIINEIKKNLGPKGHDLIKDAEVLKAELHKMMPDLDLIGNKLNILGSIDFIRTINKELTTLLNF